jgi:hypothetical protein
MWGGLSKVSRKIISYLARRKRLIEDFEKDEAERLSSLILNLQNILNVIKIKLKKKC